MEAVGVARPLVAVVTHVCVKTIRLVGGVRCFGEAVDVVPLASRSTQVGVAALKVKPVPGDGLGVALDGALLRGMRCPTCGPQADRKELLGQGVGTLGGTAGELLEPFTQKVQTGLRLRNEKLLLRVVAELRLGRRR